MAAKRRAKPPRVHHAIDEFPDAADVRAALATLGFERPDIATAMEFAAGLPRELAAAERVKAILRMRQAQRREYADGQARRNREHAAVP